MIIDTHSSMECCWATFMIINQSICLIASIGEEWLDIAYDWPVYSQSILENYVCNKTHMPHTLVQYFLKRSSSSYALSNHGLVRLWCDAYMSWLIWIKQPPKLNELMTTVICNVNGALGWWMAVYIFGVAKYCLHESCLMDPNRKANLYFLLACSPLWID